MFFNVNFRVCGFQKKPVILKYISIRRPSLEVHERCSTFYEFLRTLAFLSARSKRHVGKYALFGRVWCGTSLRSRQVAFVMVEGFLWDLLVVCRQPEEDLLLTWGRQSRILGICGLEWLYPSISASLCEGSLFIACWYIWNHGGNCFSYFCLGGYLHWVTPWHPYVWVGGTSKGKKRQLWGYKKLLT